jgi:hypothetical protein
MWRGAFLLPALLVPVEIVALLLMLGGEVVKPDTWMYWLSGQFLNLMVLMGTIVFGVLGVILKGATQYRQEPAAGWLPHVGLGLDLFLCSVVGGGFTFAHL